MDARLVLLLLAFLLAVPAQAQDDLLYNVPVNGTIEAADATAEWTFFGWRDEVMSFRAQTFDAFDPVLTVYDESGAVIVQNDDYDYPHSRDALIEAFTIPRNGNYHVVVSGFDGSTGEFLLTRIPGYAEFVVDERFVAEGEWTESDLTDFTVADGIANLQTEGVNQRGIFINDMLEIPDTYYARVTIQTISGRNGWSAGLIVGYQDDENYYQFLVNDQGLWRFSVIVDGEESALRDWNAHPAIAAGTLNFSVAAMVYGDTFDLFYDGQFISSIRNAAFDDIGSVGVGVLTANAVGSNLSVAIDDLVVTTPVSYVDGGVFPDQITPGNARQTVQDLARRGVIPPIGELAWEITESFIGGSAPGVDRLLLVESTSFTDFVMGTTVNLQSPVNNGIAACGLLFANESDTSYAVAYLDNAGGYGVSVREGDTFSPGFYNENPDWDVTDRTSLVIAAYDGTVYFFVNQAFAGTLDIDLPDAKVGNVVLNFDAVSSNCQFTNTWVWRLEDVE